MPLTDSGEAAPNNHATAAIACYECRNRKLKCDRIQPKCTRCAKLQKECLYPESKRKPGFKRKNVKDLEARLAQVEELLKGTAGERTGLTKALGTSESNNLNCRPPRDGSSQGYNSSAPSPHLDDDQRFSSESYSVHSEPFNDQPSSKIPYDGSLMWTGLSEAPPPFDMMEDLNQLFFDRQSNFLPIIHRARYLQAFYAAPHLKPPMCLQYAMWAVVSNGHEKYGAYHDIFYQRARQYAEADEMRGYGEHLITVAHAQAWCCIATDEAKAMVFTRAAMSVARAVRLVAMMGLHSLDLSEPKELCPTLLPPKDWIELEERRRTFWGAFCIDSHCSISTGWPRLIDVTEITTHLPAPEPAFESSSAVETCTLDDALKGSSYSSFAGSIIICHLFNQILNHAHRRRASDNPQDYEYGAFWQRHRELDNTLSSMFMFLPEGFRLPDNYRNTAAIHTNLNLHASVICLHHAAMEKIDRYGLPDTVKKISQDRLCTSAQEVVNIVRITGHTKSQPRSPLAALSLYCAASVYIYECKDTHSSVNLGSLNFLISAMAGIGKKDLITRAFLRQTIVDIERNHLQDIVTLPRIDNLPEIMSMGSNNIPLLARTTVSSHSNILPPLPGRLPLGHPKGAVGEIGIVEHDIASIFGADHASDMGHANEGMSNKRKRPSPESPLPGPDAAPGGAERPFPARGRLFQQFTANADSNLSLKQPNNMGRGMASDPAAPPREAARATRELPHRPNSATSSSMKSPSSHVAATGHDQSSGTSLFMQNHPYLANDMHEWGLDPGFMYSEVQLDRPTEPAEGDLWSALDVGQDVDWNAMAAAVGLNDDQNIGEGGSTNHIG